MDTTARGGSPPLVLGTAGHIDHGKTALISVLTGKNTDRLPEERSRGISIELGYAPLDLPGGRRLSVVDVPGHERFVRTMVAGASGIDLFLLCVAADDGVMPQTREHLAVLRPARRDPRRRGDHEVGPGRPRGRGRGDRGAGAGGHAGRAGVVAHADRASRSCARRSTAWRPELPGRAGGRGPARLHVDRSFTLRGIGTVVTGTLWSGSVAAGDAVVDPAARAARRACARCRCTTWGSSVPPRASASRSTWTASAGARSRRGDVVCGEGATLAPTYVVDARVEWDGEPPDGERARCTCTTGRARRPRASCRSASGFVQLRLEAPLVPARGDRFVLRQVAPPDTIGGGTVVDPSRAQARRGRRAWSSGSSGSSAARTRGAAAPEPARTAGRSRRRSTTPRSPSSPCCASDGRAPRTDAERRGRGGPRRPRAARSACRLLEAAGQVVRVGRNLHFHPEPLAELEARVVALAERDGQATIAGVRDELGRRASTRRRCSSTSTARG